MNVIQSGYSGDILVPIESKLEEGRMVFVEEEITQEKADLFVKQLIHLVLQDDEKPVNIIINSGGGELDAGLKMIDAVSHCPCKVNAYCFTKAYSMAAILFESVNGTRNMVGHAKLMFHQPAVYGLQRGTAGEVEELSKQLSNKNDLLLSIVAEKCNLDLDKLKEETVRDRYFDASEALAVGLADESLEFVDLIRNCTKGETTNEY